MVVHACNPSTREGWKQEDQESQASLGYTVRCCLKKKVKLALGAT
jgi:hypothetical protein